MDLKCQLETRTSKKGTSYTCLVVHLTDKYEKIVFLTSAELALLEKNKDSELVKPFEF